MTDPNATPRNGIPVVDYHLEEHHGELVAVPGRRKVPWCLRLCRRFLPVLRVLLGDAVLLSVGWVAFVVAVVNLDGIFGVAAWPVYLGAFALTFVAVRPR